MTLDSPGKPDEPRWLTLTEAAARTGYSREALRQRVRRGKLNSQKGNDGVVRLDAQQLTDLPPIDTLEDDRGASMDSQDALTLDMLRSAMDDLRTDLDRARTALDKAQTDHLDAHGRAERAEARTEAEAKRANEAERRLAATEAALAEARTPWAVRVLRAFKGN